MKKFIAFILAFSLLVPSVAAADVYDIRPDTKISLMSTGYDVALTSVTQSELDSTLRSYLSASSSSYTVAGLLYRLCYSDGPLWDSGQYLQYTGQSTYGGNYNLAFYVRNGFLGLWNELNSIESYLDNPYRGIFAMADSLDGIESGISSVNSSILSGLGTSGAIYTALGVVNTSVSSLVDLIRSFTVVSAGSDFLNHRGIVSSDSRDINLRSLLRNGFLGIRSLIAGSESDNVYSGTSLNNENESTSFTATGLGPMLNTWLGDIQNDLALVSYVFASPQDLELKAESADNMDAVGDSLLSPDSSSSVKVSDITDISSASDSIQALGQTGVTPGQAFDQLDDSSLFSFFTAETAANLDTTVTTYSRDSHTQIVTNYYEQSRLDFFDLIGKEGDG